ncbi:MULTISPECIES: alpha amylase family protein [Sphingobacterium]|uniref:alpha amylase family protein n=1 Tax=Sphingobacterium TaxID=28453 RepID=UPI0013DC7329|nr:MULTISPECIES: alpha amylase family protein [unclassified Sphingobacterium]
MKVKTLIFLLFGLLLIGCKKGSDNAPPKKEPEVEEPKPGEKKREVLVWVDARSNVFGTYGKFSDKEQIKGILDKLKDAGTTGLVIDVKPSSGYLMYASQYAPEFKALDGKNKPADYVEFVLSEAKKRGFKAYLSIVTFVEADGFRKFGYGFDNPGFREKYESVVVKDVNGTLGKITETGKNMFVNPAAKEVQDRVLNIIKEIVGKFELDGLILDYGRYTDVTADFSELSKIQFVDFMKRKYNQDIRSSLKFPSDIVTSWKTSGEQLLPNVQGKYYRQWLVYRASVIQDFVKKARGAVKSIKPNVDFGVYVGAWYTTYYQVGVNWASKDYDPFQDFEVRFDWAYPGYGETGYAEELDLLMTGNYFTQIMLKDNSATASLKYHWWSIEGSLNGIEYITKNRKPLYGSIDVGNVAYANKSEISKAIKYILSRTSGGVMLFDVVHMYAPEYNKLKVELFDAVKEGVKN